MEGQAIKAGERSLLELTIVLKQMNPITSVHCLTVFVPLEIQAARMNVHLENCRQTLLDSHRVLGAPCGSTSLATHKSNKRTAHRRLRKMLLSSTTRTRTFFFDPRAPIDDFNNEPPVSPTGIVGLVELCD